jgi:hypothetical protein
MRSMHFRSISLRLTVILRREYAPGQRVSLRDAMCRSMRSAMCLAGYDGSKGTFGVPSAARPMVPSCVLDERVSCEGMGLTSVCGCEMITFK